MRTRIIILLLACVSAAAFAAPPKVAVLDAVLPEGMEKQVAIGVTEKISEELVASGKYTVLDRTTVGQSLKEIEFQMSGIVSDADIKKAGEQLNSRLGAAYVVVARVSQLANTFFVSAKLIDIKTGEITAQASYESEGNVAITLSVAQVVGKKLALGAKESTQIPEQEPTTPVVTTTPTVQPSQPSQSGQPQESALLSRLIVFYMIPIDSGSALDSMTGWTLAGDTFSSIAFNLHWLQAFFGGLYVSGFFGYNESDISWDTDNAVFYSIMDFQVGMGFGLPMGAGLQLYAGALIGYSLLTLGDYWDTYGPAAVSGGDSQGGLSFGVETGIDWILLDSIAISARFHLSDLIFDAVDIFGEGDDVMTIGVSFGVGFAY